MTTVSAGQLQHQLLRQVATVRPAEASTFRINGKDIGLVLPNALPFFLSLPEELRSALSFSGQSIELTCPAPELDERLDAMGRHWYRAGALSRWCDELLDVVTHDGRIVAKAERAMFRFLGMTTTCVHGVGFQNGKWLMSLRSRTKLIQPGKWDTLVGGLVGAGESHRQALQRETLEEAGLPPTSYRIGQPSVGLYERPLPDGWLREYSVTYPMYLLDSASPRNMDGEVERIESVDGVTLLSRIADNQVTVEASLSFLSLMLDQEPFSV
ncbi:MAG: NUDIX domain-containing protein [Duodenibacillus sp.]|nr:NUDIX domain-containing protein [Duodenibacillus sp.]